VLEAVARVLIVRGPDLVRYWRGVLGGTDFVEGPETRIIAIAERPGGVDRAYMVDCTDEDIFLRAWYILISCQRPTHTRRKFVGTLEQSDLQSAKVLVSPRDLRSWLRLPQQP
jgi:hypothetical protein